MGMSSHPTAQEGDMFCVPEMCFGPKCAYQPKNKSKRPCEDAGWAGKSVSLSTVKRILYWHGLKGHSAHRDKDLNCWRHVLWSDKTKIELFGHNDHRYVWGGSLQAWEHPPNCEIRGWQHHVVGLFCCRRDWCTSQNRWHHELRTLCGNVEATSQDISQEVKAWAQMGLPNGQWHEAYCQTGYKVA